MDNELSEPSTVQMTSDKSIATLRFKWNSSIIKVTATSISDIEEVSAAINKVKKNTLA